MIAIAIYSVDQTLRRRLAELPREDPAIALVGIAESPVALEALAEKHHLDVVLSGEAGAKGELADWQARSSRQVPAPKRRAGGLTLTSSPTTASSGAGIPGAAPLTT
jgi:hypothetical protein